MFAGKAHGHSSGLLQAVRVSPCETKIEPRACHRGVLVVPLPGPGGPGAAGDRALALSDRLGANPKPESQPQ